jgi:eukaryotic-like serine/threonine-protein kinase
LKREENEGLILEKGREEPNVPVSIGQVLNNRYRIVKLLGQGGFGAVYKAWDLNLGKHWALKENLDTSPEAERQFTREATILANLSHPNLPQVTDHFSLPGQGQYLVMDFIEGEDLERLLQRQGRVPADRAIIWIAQVADALVYLHSQNPPVLHRDLKPGNIRITPAGQAMLVDFGLVKVYDPSLRTTIGARAVTPGYSPPEQYGQGSTDIRSDIYALGATLYTLLTGLEPQESVQRFADDQMIPASSINPQVPADIGQAVAHAMALKPSQRYQTVTEFKQALTTAKTLLAAPNLPTLLVSPVIPQPAAAPFPRPHTGRKKWIIPLGIAAGIGCLALAIVFILVILPGIFPPAATATPAPVYPATAAPATVAPATAAPATVAPATVAPATVAPATVAPATVAPATAAPAVNPGPVAPQLYADENFLCLEGPGTSYPHAVDVYQGSTHAIIGRSANHPGWLRLAINQSNTHHTCCWIRGGVISGDISLAAYTDELCP